MVLVLTQILNMFTKIAENENPDDADTITVTFDLAAAGIIASGRLFVRVEAE